MRGIERFELIDRIGRELQARMSYSDIDAFLPAFNIDITKPTSSVNSKWVYVKELLADASSETIIRIADELDMDHPYVLAPANEITESRFWEPSHFKLFLSHLSSFKKTVGQLQIALRKYGISTFVAHVDIEPTRKWQDEIEAALFSMDALAAILMPGFEESNWTDQEVGVAIGRGVPVIPIIKGLDPYGFIGKYQGLNTSRKSVNQVAEALFKILVSSPNTRSRILTCLVDTTVISSSPEDVANKLEIIGQLYSLPIYSLPVSHLERLREAAMGAAIFRDYKDIRSQFNTLLAENNLEPILESDAVFGDISSSSDDLPF